MIIIFNYSKAPQPSIGQSLIFGCITLSRVLIALMIGINTFFLISLSVWQHTFSSSSILPVTPGFPISHNETCLFPLRIFTRKINIDDTEGCDLVKIQYKFIRKRYPKVQRWVNVNRMVSWMCPMSVQTTQIQIELLLLWGSLLNRRVQRRLTTPLTQSLAGWRLARSPSLARPWFPVRRRARKAMPKRYFQPQGLLWSTHQPPAHHNCVHISVRFRPAFFLRNLCLELFCAICWSTWGKY